MVWLILHSFIIIIVSWGTDSLIAPITSHDIVTNLDTTFSLETTNVFFTTLSLIATENILKNSLLGITKL